MYAKSFSILALAAASLVAAQDFTVATPPYVQQCAPLKISWKGGEPPYRPFITAPGKIDDVKESIDKTSDTTTTWKVTIPQGQKFTINVCDNSGQCQASGVAGPVGKGDDSCMNGGDSKGGSSGGGSGGGAAAGGGGSSGGDDKKSGGGDDNKSGGGDDNKSSSGGDDKKSSSSSDNKSSSSSGGKSSSSSGQSSTGGGSGGGSSSAQPSSTGMGGGSGSDDKSGQDNKEGGSDDNGGEKKGGDNGSMSFSGVPAVVAGVVGVVVAALI